MEQLSLKLGKWLDDKGFDEDMRDFKKRSIEIIGVLTNILNTSSTDCLVPVGSENEGASLYLTDSDKDWLLYNPFIEVTYGCESTQHHDPNVCYLHMTRETTTPAGYTKLKLSKAHTGQFHTEAIKHEICMDTNGQTFLTNKIIERLPQNSVEHGPAMILFPQCNTTYDLVFSYISHKLPDDVAPWFHRDRHNGWPSPDTCKLFKKMGCFVVGIGHPNSPECYLEWRISMSNQELHLMQNLNPTQYKCYILLKLFKSNLKKVCGDIISSYHCKTALFYTIENTDQNIWIPEKLVLCFQKCLQQLNEWVVERNCPNYFIPEENMFELKLTEDASVKMIRDNLQLLQLSIQNYSILEILNEAYQRRSSLKIVQFLNSILALTSWFIGTSSTHFAYTNLCKNEYKRSMNQDLNIEINYLKYVQKNMEDWINYVNDIKPQNTYHPFPETAIFWLMNRNNPLDSQKTAAAKSLNEDDMMKSLLYHRDVILQFFPMLIKHMQSYIAYLLLAKFVNDEEESTWLEANQYITAVGETGKMETIVKLATVHYIRGNNHECSEDLLKWHPPHIQMTICNSHSNPVFHKKNFVVLEKKLKNGINTRFMNILEGEHQVEMDKIPTCIVFSTLELIMIPIPLIYEVCKIVQLDVTPLVEVDPSVYVYFLKYKSYEQLDNKARMNSALLKLEESVLSDLQSPTLYHPDVALNVLGHIYVTKGWYRLALHCFKRSWEIIFVDKLVKPYPDLLNNVDDSMKQNMITHNAAKWNVMLLLFSWTDDIYWHRSLFYSSLFNVEQPTDPTKPFYSGLLNVEQPTDSTKLFYSSLFDVEQPTDSTKPMFLLWN